MEKILVTKKVPEVCLDWLRAQNYEVIHTFDVSEENICALVSDVSAILSRELRTTRKILDAAKKLKIIARFGIGTDMIDVEYATKKGVWISITPYASYISVAEHALALMMACAKSITVCNDKIRKDDWFSAKDNLNAFQLAEKTLGIIGLGRIGAAFAKMARGLDMRIIAYDKYAPANAFPEGIERKLTMEELLRESDVVSLHCPLTEENYHMINAQALSQMKKGSYLINTSRGKLVDGKALFEALSSGHLRGAGLDVMETEPISIDNPLMQLDNVIFTPHSAAATEEALYLQGMHAAYCIDDVLKGKPPRWPFNHIEK